MNSKKHNKFNPAINETISNSLIASADIAIIGGGVVGCAVARKMALEGATVKLCGALW